MNLNPLYELRERLLGSAIAGLNLINEDFRLSKAIEQMATLKKAAPVFNNIYELAKQVIDPESKDRGQNLLEVLALLDAVICTQCTTAVSGERKSIQLPANTASSNAPYSQAAPLIRALKGTGGGRYNVIIETFQNNNEIIHDFRIQEALVYALSDSYSEIADFVEKQLCQMDKSIVMVLKRDFDPAGKKDMVRRIHVIEAISGGEENPFYISMLEHAEKPVKEALILALHHDPDNAEILIELEKTEKGTGKEATFNALSYMKSPSSFEFWKAKFQKNPESCSVYLRFTEDDNVSEMIAQTQQKYLQSLVDRKEHIFNQKDNKKFTALFTMIIAKSTPSICEVYRMAAKYQSVLKSYKKPQDSNEDTLSIYYRETGYCYYKEINHRMLQDVFPAFLLYSLLYNGNEKLVSLSRELYDTYGDAYIAHVFIADLLTLPGAEVFHRYSEYFKTEQEGKLIKENTKEKMIRTNLMNVLGRIHWDDKKKQYYLLEWYYNPQTQTEFAARLPLAEQLAEEWFTLLTDNHLSKKGYFFVTIESANRYMISTYDAVLENIINPDSEICTSSMGNYFYERALSTSDNYKYCSILAKCRFTKCRGIMVKHFCQPDKKRRNMLYSSEIERYINAIPLSNEDKAEELEELLKTIKDMNMSSLLSDDMVEQIKYWCNNLRTSSSGMEG